MRDIVLALIVFGSLPVTFFQPYVGVLMWSWIGYMNPHRLTSGFAYDFPFAAVIGATTLVAMLFSREPKRLPMTPLVWVWLLFTFWLCVAMLFAMYPDDSYVKWIRAMKILLISFVSIVLITDKKRLHLLIWVIVLSLGYYGTKGGIFTLTRNTGGLNLVWGPPGSFIEENNALAFALIMTLPLMRYLQLTATNVWVKRGLLLMIILNAISIVGSHSRGAFLAGGAIVLYLWLKSENRFRIALGLALVGTLIVTIAPSNWFERMGTIRTYEQDSSAMGRINAWETAFNLSLDRPIVGGGFNAFQFDETFQRYSPQPENVHDTHSIYFEVLGETGYVGLVLFLALGILAIRTGGWILRATHAHPELKWAGQLGAMLQVSLIGFAVGGAFLGLAFFDLYYHLIAMLVITRALVEQELLKKSESNLETASIPDGEQNAGREKSNTSA